MIANFIKFELHNYASTDSQMSFKSDRNVFSYGLLITVIPLILENVNYVSIC